MRTGVKSSFPNGFYVVWELHRGERGLLRESIRFDDAQVFPELDAAAILVAFERVFANRHHVVGRVAVRHSVGDDGDASEGGIAARHFHRGIAWGENAVEQVAVFKIIVCGLCACACKKAEQERKKRCFGLNHIRIICGCRNFIPKRTLMIGKQHWGFQKSFTKSSTRGRE